MSSNIKMFFESLKNKKIAFIGMGVSNFDCIRMFINKGIDVTVLDKNNVKSLGENASVLKNMGVKFICGDNHLENLHKFDVVVRSPGVYFHKKELMEAKKKNVIITSEMELFFLLCPCKIVAVTGSDGKTTTTSIISEMLKKQGHIIHLGGNIGKALLPEVEKISCTDIAVVELSSFQLLSMRTSPDIAVITNIAPNHLDVHGTMEEYIYSKQNILLHQNAFSKAVLNLDNALCNEQETLVRGKLEKFSRKSEVLNGAFYDERSQTIFISKNGIKKPLMKREDIKLPGIHNVENYLAAITAIHEIVDDESIKYVANSFLGVKHRLEFVKEIDGVKWYNDSIATSPTRTIAGLDSFDQKIIVIAGGYDKNIPFAPLAPKLVEKVKSLILMGKTAEKIEDALKEQKEYNGSNPKVYHVCNMEDAVLKANEISKKSDIVSLSPASASFDIYKNFEVRGDHFKELVLKL